MLPIQIANWGYTASVCMDPNLIISQTNFWEYHGLFMNFQPWLSTSCLSILQRTDDWDLSVRAEVQAQNVRRTECHQVTTLGTVKRQVTRFFFYWITHHKTYPIDLNSVENQDAGLMFFSHHASSGVAWCCYSLLTSQAQSCCIGFYSIFHLCTGSFPFVIQDLLLSCHYRGVPFVRLQGI